MSPIFGSLGAATVRGFRALGSAFSNFLDNFNRTTSGSLGTPSGGTGTWLATSGTWNANGTQATSATAASSYPIASVEMGTSNVTINLDVSTNNGAGAAFWVSDSQNWWGVIPWQATSVTYAQACSTYGQSTGTYVCNAYAINAYTQVCNSGYTYSFAYCSMGQQTNYAAYCSSQNITYSSVCNAYTMGYDGFRGIYYQVCNAYGQNATYSCGAYGQGISGYSCVGGAYTLGFGQVCNVYGQGGGTQYCSTSSGPFYSAVCNVYFSQTVNNPGTRYLRLIKSVANTVTTVLDQTVSAAIASIKVIISAGTITGRAYSAAGQVTQTGTDLTNTPVSPTTGTKHGIILAPGGYSQGNTVDNISIILP